MTVLIDLTIQNLLERKHKVENCKNCFSKYYWFKRSEMQKIDDELQEIIRSNFTKVLLPEKKYHDFTFDDVFETYLEYYIFDYSYIPLGKYINTQQHTEMIGFTDPVQIQFTNAIFFKDSTGSNIYTRNDTIVSRPIYVKTIHLNST